MRRNRFEMLLVFALFALENCGGDAEPPLEDMPLRDALLAEPGVIAHLSSKARQHLRERFATSRLLYDADTLLNGHADKPFLQQVAAMDAVRFAQGRDALLTGSWLVTSAGAQAVSFSASILAQPQNPLPPLGGDFSAETTLFEQRALAGPAGAAIEQLLASSGAQSVQRVVAWPIAALASADTVYVNAAWLVAMDENSSGCGSAGNAGNFETSPTANANQGGLYGYLVSGGSGLDTSAGAGAAAAEGDITEAGPHSPNQASSSDLCSSSSCKSSDCSTSDCNNSTDCNNNNNSCHSSDCDSSDKSCCRACTIAAPAPNPLLGNGALLWLLLPLGFLLKSERENGRRWRRQESAPESLS